MSEIAVLEREVAVDTTIENIQDPEVNAFNENNDNQNNIIYSIGDFECPLDMILQIIHDQKINIEDIFVSSLTSKYMEALRNTPKEQLDYEYMSEFIKTAAELVHLKARAATTIPEVEEYVDDECQDFIDRVKLYDIFKQQTPKLKEREVINRFVTKPKYSEKDYRVQLKDFDIDKLVQAYANAIVNGEVNRVKETPKIIKKLKFSTKDKETEIRDLIVKRKYMKFSDLIQDDFDNGDIVTTFFAVLSLAKFGILETMQEQMFGEIDLIGTTDADIIEIVNEEELNVVNAGL